MAAGTEHAQAHAAARSPRRRGRAARPVRGLGDAGAVRRDPPRARRGSHRRSACSTSATWARSRRPGRTRRRSSSAILSNDVSKIAEDGAQYSVLCKDDGGVLDDLFSYRLGPQRFLTVTNASNHEKDLAWFKQHASGFDVEVHDRLHDYAMLAVQGPDARGLVAQLAQGELPKRFRTATLTVAGARERPRRRHRLHGRGRRRAAARARARGRGLGRARRQAAPPRSASAPATPCASRSASTSTATTCPRIAGRSRPASAGAARRTRASSAPTSSASSASRAPSSSSCRSS